MFSFFVKKVNFEQQAKNEFIKFPPKHIPEYTNQKSIIVLEDSNNNTIQLDLNSILYELLKKIYNSCVRIDEWIYIDGLWLSSKLINITSTNTSFQTSSVIEIYHKTLIPETIFEFQHWTENTIESSFQKGFVNWTQTDIGVLLQAIGKDQKLTYMDFNFESEGKKITRRAILGNILHFTKFTQAASQEEHCFCPCCFLTNTMENYTDLLKSNNPIAIRYFGSRDENGSISSDFRINGLEVGVDKNPLPEYIATWTDCGFEFRKQYVFIYTI